MKINKNSLLKSLIYSMILLILIIIIFFFRYENIFESNYSYIFYFLIVIAFAGSLYWTYHQIEFNKLIYKDEKRPRYGWLWWPNRNLADNYLWRVKWFVSVFLPFLVLICLNILGYPIYVGLIFAIILFFIIIFSITKLSNFGY